ncbi:hypothetical protein NM75689_0525, partial [Neisseria meningitidis 75689]
YLFEHDLKKFKQYAYVAGKLGILQSVDDEDPEPFFFPCDMLNIQDPMFLMLMSDSPQLREFLVRNIDNIANDTEAFINRYDLNRHMIYNTLLMVEGKQLDRLNNVARKSWRIPPLANGCKSGCTITASSSLSPNRMPRR